LTAVSDGNFHELYFIFKSTAPITAAVTTLQFNAK
jgi:hypothetical protein